MWRCSRLLLTPVKDRAQFTATTAMSVVHVALLKTVIDSGQGSGSVYRHDRHVRGACGAAQDCHRLRSRIGLSLPPRPPCQWCMWRCSRLSLTPVQKRTGGSCSRKLHSYILQIPQCEYYCIVHLRASSTLIITFYFFKKKIYENSCKNLPVYVPLFYFPKIQSGAQSWR